MNKSNSSKKVFVGLSGGVDSAVSAYLLKEQGYDVTGVFMKNWSGDDFGIQDECPWEEDQASAIEVAEYLDIPFMSFNFEKEYRDKVVEYFFDEYKSGRTPNPDVMCNKEIKFKLFLDRALEEGADFIATGHYARKVTSSELRVTGNTLRNKKATSQNPELETRHSLLKGVDPTKNQVYFLYNITQEQLKHVLFPIGDIEKAEVRSIAKSAGLPNADRPDSQGICFIGKINVLNFLMSRIPKKPGKVVDIETNKEVGDHEGIYFYTIGQRAKIANQSDAYFYCDKNVDENIMYVCHGTENVNLYSDSVELEDLHLINSVNINHSLQNSEGESPTLPSLKGGKMQAMVRYRQEPQPGVLYFENDSWRFKFDQKIRAIASGQSLVLFDGDVCLGGGIIK
ncbi:MAG: tRNA 2-thiouridine(34) synthase MnmA [Candidatus Dojkabacteria bacterium]|nr:tRNA 2-thiouridine(34) synthase MnmA [Candidatus Dojkabacteria bacterium]